MTLAGTKVHPVLLLCMSHAFLALHQSVSLAGFFFLGDWW